MLVALNVVSAQISNLAVCTKQNSNPSNEISALLMLGIYIINIIIVAIIRLFLDSHMIGIVKYLQLHCL